MSRRAPRPGLSGCDKHHDCETCPLSACPYGTVRAEDRFRRRVDAARQLLGAGWTAGQVAQRFDLELPFVYGLNYVAGITQPEGGAS